MRPSAASITANTGQQRPGWFDLTSFDFQGKDLVQDRDGLLESARMIDGYIQEEIKAGIPSERIVVGGFSQGGTLSLLVGLTSRGGGGWKLSGVFPLCNWIPLGDEFANMASPYLTKTPMLMCHGTADDLVTNDMVDDVKKLLACLGLPVLGDEVLVTEDGKLASPGFISKSYDGVGHEVVSQEILVDLERFLKRVLADD